MRKNDWILATYKPRVFKAEYVYWRNRICHEKILEHRDLYDMMIEHGEFAGFQREVLGDK